MGFIVIFLVIILIIIIFFSTKKDSISSNADISFDSSEVEKRKYNKTAIQFEKMIAIPLNKDLVIEVENRSDFIKVKIDSIYYDAEQNQFLIKAYKFLDSDKKLSGKITTLFSSKLGYISYNGVEYDGIYELLKDIDPNNKFLQKQNIKNEISKITFEYVNSNGESSKRTVDIDEVYLTGGCYYVRGFCHLRNEKRTFRIDKMFNIIDTSTNEKFATYNEYLNKIKKLNGFR